MDRRDSSVLVLGLGNRLLGDDAAGLLVVDTLAASGRAGSALLRDGGTIGLEPAAGDRGCRGAHRRGRCRVRRPPGAVRVFEGATMDRQLGGRKRSAQWWRCST